jgi:hypothetical protein
MSNRVAVMQPYIFPHIGYMNLVHASDHFIFYDDVNFINKGWINRNRVILSGNVYRFTIPLRDASQNRKINEIQPENLKLFGDKFLQQIIQSYRGANFFKATINYIESVLHGGGSSIGELAAHSVVNFFKHIGANKSFIKSSEKFSSTQGLGRVKRLVQITKELNSTTYLNSIGGVDLYSKTQFFELGVELRFVRPRLVQYNQFNSKEFQSGLSIIDLLMNLSIEQLHEHVQSYDLI